MKEVTRVVIDQPQTRCLTKPAGAINGWFALRDNEEIPEELQFRVGPIVLPHVMLKRPDVESAMPEHIVVGFQIRFDLSNYLLYIADGRLVIDATIEGYDPFRLKFKIMESAMAGCIAAASG